MNPPFIQFTPETLKAFKVAYEKARSSMAKSFEFQGETILVKYAYYMIEFAEDQLNSKKKEERK